MKETLKGIDRALTAQRVDATPPLDKNVETTFGIYRRQDGQLAMGNKIVQLNSNKKTLTVDDTEYEFTSCLHALIMWKHPRRNQWNSNDYTAYKSLVAQTKLKSFPNPAGAARPHATWKYKHMLRKMAMPGEQITKEEESEDIDDTASIGDIGESSPSILSSDSGMLSHGNLISHHHLPILVLMEKLKRRGVEDLFIKVTQVTE